MALRKLRFASSRCSAGELTFGEFGSELWDSPEGRPRVKSDGLMDMVMLLAGGLILTRNEQEKGNSRQVGARKSTKDETFPMMWTKERLESVWEVTVRRCDVRCEMLVHGAVPQDQAVPPNSERP